MSDIAPYPAAELTPTAVPVSELSIWSTASLATVTGVGWALLNTPSSTRMMAFPIFVLGAGAMFGLGLTDIARGRDRHFARSLLVAGVLWSLSALTASSAPAANSVGHVSQWCIELAIAYLLLSYPSGRLADRTARALFGLGAWLVGLLFLPTALAGQFPNPSAWSRCTSACPHNVFSTGHSPLTVALGVIVPLRSALAVALFAAIAVALMRRARRAERLLGHLYVPIATCAAAQSLILAVYFLLRAAAPDSDATRMLSWIFVLSLPAIGVVCGTGRLYRRMRTATVLERVARSLKGSSTAAQVRVGLADALQDPSLRILHSFPGDSRGWVDEAGTPVPLTRNGADRRVTQISSGSWRIALLHDPVLAEDRSLIDSAGAYALAALENQCLADELHASLRALAAARAGRLTTEQETREKIERDLHDGAQQRLLALRLKLGLVATRLAGRDPAGAESIRDLENDVDATIDEVRSLARGIYPPLLARTGLRDALRAAGYGTSIPTTVHAEGLNRYEAEIETAVYFSCSEALQNAAKHARTATGVTISVWQDVDLHFEVRDDGAGFDQRSPSSGTGLGNLRDRLNTLGGTIIIQSAPGQGTVVGGSIPIA
ncbi:MAG TPA: histidine kinase [Solirubrobacteraceae bacterium]|jgi:signal transduction histidine kinase|nr:histidine kinase [Solirubrobacteraceae bacterium]